jgi:hypothetical protein
MKSVSVIIFLILLCLKSAFPQGEIDNQSKILYRNERTLALTLNSNGYSADFRYARRRNAFKKSLYAIEFSYVKHEKEAKITLFSSQQLGNSFVYGKLNSFWTLRIGLGMQKEIFQKQDKGGISIRYFYHFGPVIGFLKPIYYELEPDSSGHSPVVKFEAHLTTIERKAPFYTGLNELSVVPGVYTKLGFTFEFSKNDAVFSAIETGIGIDAFARVIPIMANDQNHWLFLSFFLTYRFGKVIDVRLNHGVTKLDEMLTN